MNVTAARLGTSPIMIDWSSLGPRPGGIDTATSNNAWAQLKARFAAGEVGFFDTPSSNDLSQAAESQAMADEILRRGVFTDCLFLGIGGSSLGPLSLLAALPEKRKSKIRFHFMENPDPIDWKTTLSGLNPDTTLVCAVTKSGTTFETMAQLLCALEWLTRERWKTHLIAITDPTKGDLKAFAKNENIPTLTIHPSLGGRFSVFSPVGLFAAALAGLNTAEFMNGAKQVRDYVEKTSIDRNVFFVLADELIRHSQKRPIHVCMPYSTRLKTLGAWFVQLWGESLGKDGKGFTPLAAVGATDQHSILQLLRDGPDDKITLFMTVDHVDDPVKIPKGPKPGDAVSNYPAFKLLEGHSLQELLMTEFRATSLVLAKRGRPSITIRLDRLDERAMGAVFFMFSVLTAVTGTLMGVNPFDKPGVEEGKVYTREALATASSDAKLRLEEDDNSPVARLRRT